ncbi:hypothetical protein P153DRAFT_369362 [Dothidotthia symphoricarpi CBS 119687]|uniref:F-box domain-containing protein n=1 Tax=Dothidotthia symphoricarpi CBS 119687 TaxID=1392245 RepID=A0A6A6A505_9PLEO|nr:uncharacterized protein P153DRAFT_369362 [Dothidotthia symphoricarpi CBS 119687]KAF2125977.1 hypothetical protein P153DRAFT_369362 [Dothidotthia symphoricarpi CBS 119687]
MAKKSAQTSFFSLPAELRLQIATYALDQPVDAGFELRSADATQINHYPQLGPGSPIGLVGLIMAGPYSPGGAYSPAANLSLLLVCRQFRLEFTELAWRSTTFFLGINKSTRDKRAMAGGVPEGRLCMLRKVAIYSPPWDDIVRWGQWPFDAECVRLERLSFVMVIGLSDIAQFVRLLRRLQNVKQLKFISQSDAEQQAKFRNTYNQLIGAIMKEDHYQRYDASGAPHVGDVWWEWSFNDVEKSFLLVAEKPAPVIPEEEYLQFMKPRIDVLMADMARE